MADRRGINVRGSSDFQSPPANLYYELPGEGSSDLSNDRDHDPLRSSPTLSSRIRRILVVIISVVVAIFLILLPGTFFAVSWQMGLLGVIGVVSAAFLSIVLLISARVCRLPSAVLYEQWFSGIVAALLVAILELAFAGLLLVVFYFAGVVTVENRVLLAMPIWAKFVFESTFAFFGCALCEEFAKVVLVLRVHAKRFARRPRNPRRSPELVSFSGEISSGLPPTGEGVGLFSPGSPSPEEGSRLLAQFDLPEAARPSFGSLQEYVLFSMSSAAGLAVVENFVFVVTRYVLFVAPLLKHPSGNADALLFTMVLLASRVVLIVPLQTFTAGIIATRIYKFASKKWCFRCICPLFEPWLLHGIFETATMFGSIIASAYHRDYLSFVGLGAGGGVVLITILYFVLASVFCVGRKDPL